MRTVRMIVAGVAACVAASQAAAQEAAGDLAPGSRPNILLIVGDDLGYQDIGYYGSEIRTPNIDALAADSLVFTNFYVSVACQPTRAMLLSGTSNHMAGVGAQGRVVADNPSYLNHLSERVVTVADRMGAAGYHTYMVGKWHLGYDDGLTPADRGFDRSFVLLDPGASHFEDMIGFSAAANPAQYRNDGEVVESLRSGFYSTVDYTNHMIGFIEEAAQTGQPFFGYMAYTTPHWPIHALPEDMERTRGRYDEGWDVLREQRFARWKALGFADADAPAPGFVATYEPWDSLTDEEKALESRKMEAYAAMVERFDIEIGRLLDTLRETGELDNTLILFMSDNGSEYTGQNWPGMSDYFDTFDNSLENIGHPGSYLMPGPGWGEAGSASYYLSKGFLADGGQHVPAFVHAPALGLEAGRSDAVVAAFDLAPTFVELAGGDITDNGGKADALPVTGRSFADVLMGGEGRPDSEAVMFEHGGQRSIRRGDWKALWLNPPNGTGDWQLFNLVEDPAESNDLAAENPELLAEMTAGWESFAEANHVAPPAGPPPARPAADD